MQGSKKELFQVEFTMRKMFIAGLMAVGLLAGCGGTTSDGTEGMTTVCADGTACTGSADECAQKCSLSDGKKHAEWFYMPCCDGTDCITPNGPGQVTRCENYCDQGHDGTTCYAPAPVGR